MASYGYTHLSWSTNGISVNSTDEKLLDDISAEIKRFIPGADVYFAEKDIQGNNTFLHASKLDGHDSEIGRWLFKWLLQQGWGVLEKRNTDSFDLSKKVEADPGS